MTSRVALDFHPFTIADQRGARAAQGAVGIPRELESFGERMGPHREIGARACGFQEGLGRAHAEAAALIHVEVADAGVVTGVEVVDARNAGLCGCLRERIEDVPAQTLFGDTPRAARAMQVAVRATLAAMTALVRTKIRQYVRPAPRVIARCRGPRVVVARLATHVDHAVDTGAAAQDLAARIQQIASVEAGFGFGAETPVGARIADAAQIAHGNVDPRIVVRTAGFDEQYATRGSALRRLASRQPAVPAPMIT